MENLIIICITIIVLFTVSSTYLINEVIRTLKFKDLILTGGLACMAVLSCLPVGFATFLLIYIL